MSKNELLSDKANSGAAASRLKCAKKVLDLHRHFIDDFMGPQHGWQRMRPGRYRSSVLTLSVFRESCLSCRCCFARFRSRQSLRYN